MFGTLGLWSLGVVQWNNYVKGLKSNVTMGCWFSEKKKLRALSSPNMYGYMATTTNWVSSFFFFCIVLWFFKGVKVYTCQEIVLVEWPTLIFDLFWHVTALEIILLELVPEGQICAQVKLSQVSNWSRLLWYHKEKQDFWFLSYCSTSFTYTWVTMAIFFICVCCLGIVMVGCCLMTELCEDTLKKCYNGL